MAGVKGKSGRRSHNYHVNLDRVFCKAIKETEDVLEDQNIAAFDKVKLVMPFIMKYMPEKIALKAEINLELQEAMPQLLEVMQRKMVDYGANERAITDGQEVSGA